MISIFRDYYLSPIGWIEILADSHAIMALNFVNSKGSIQENFLTVECKKQLDAYFMGQLHLFSIPLNPIGTKFQQKVWKVLQKIDYGEVITYRDVAIRLGCPKSIRAVANAIGKNPILILIPCHRVIGSNGNLTGYAAGIERKEYLLNHEKEH